MTLEQKRQQLKKRIGEMSGYEVDFLTSALEDVHVGRDPKVRTVTDFISKYTLNNGDSFYTPMELTPTQASDHLEEVLPTTKTVLALPYGRICDNCGGSMLAIIQLGSQGEVLRTDLVDCG